jgi:hypothetical protein
MESTQKSKTIISFGGFPQVRAVVSLVSPSLFVVRPNTKSVPNMHYQKAWKHVSVSN